MIYFSVCSVIDEGKSASKDFHMTMEEDLEEVLRVWRTYSISQAIFSKMIRFDKYKKSFVEETRRRIHNVSFVGNVFIYDFDDGDLSMSEFTKRYDGKFNFLAVKSKNDHKYEYDRFKVMVVHDVLFVQSTTTDGSPDGLQTKDIGSYLDYYIGFAENYDFWQYCDHATKDISRLSSNVAKEGDFYICQS